MADLKPVSRKKLGHEFETYVGSILLNMLKKKNLLLQSLPRQGRRILFQLRTVKIIDGLMDFLLGL